MSLTGDRLREEGLTRPGRPIEEHAARNPRTDFMEFVGGCKELADLFEFFNGFIFTGHVGESDVGALLVELFRLRLGETAEHLISRHGAHEQEKKAEKEEQRNEHLHDRGEEGGLRAQGVPPLRRLRICDRREDVLGLRIGVGEVDVLAELRRAVAEPRRLVRIGLCQRKVDLLGGLVEDGSFNRVALEDLESFGSVDCAGLESLPEEPPADHEDKEWRNDPRPVDSILHLGLRHGFPIQFS